MSVVCFSSMRERELSDQWMITSRQRAREAERRCLSTTSAAAQHSSTGAADKRNKSKERARERG
jgi:hypothetical protein